MKKLMILAAVAAMAVCSQASSFKWSAANIYDGTGASASGNKVSGLTAYLFDAGTISMADMYKKVGQTGWSDSSISSKAVASGAIAATTFEYGTTGNAYDMYFVILADDGKTAYFSNLKEDQAAKESGQTTTVAFANQSPGSITKPTESGFLGAGAWSNVPEPTSGLLLLLGMAGLALRRRRA